VTSAIILAGGLGTRLQSVVSDVPKPMAPINGRPFLAYLLDYWITQGICNFVLSVGYKYESIISYFGVNYNSASIDYAIEPSPLGTGGGLMLAFKLLNQEEPFLLLNGDTFFALDLKVLLSYAEKRNADWCISVFKSTEINRYLGVNLSEDGKILSLKALTGGMESMVNGGVYVVHPRTLLSLPNYFQAKFSIEDDLIPGEISRGQSIVGYSSDTFFIDIGLPSDYQRALKYFTGGLSPI